MASNAKQGEENQVSIKTEEIEEEEEQEISTEPNMASNAKQGEEDQVPVKTEEIEEEESQISIKTEEIEEEEIPVFIKTEEIEEEKEQKKPTEPTTRCSKASHRVPAFELIQQPLVSIQD